MIITSNKEKGNLPAPFLRRCIYHFITFPEAQLRAIVETHFTRQGVAVPTTTDLAIKRFLALRNGERLHKKPGTSEFLDWLEALRNFSPPASPPAQLTEAGPRPRWADLALGKYLGSRTLQQQRGRGAAYHAGGQLP